jgi:hypothetical protein
MKHDTNPRAPVMRKKVIDTTTMYPTYTCTAEGEGEGGRERESERKREGGGRERWCLRNNGT